MTVLCYNTFFLVKFEVIEVVTVSGRTRFVILFRPL